MEAYEGEWGNYEKPLSDCIAHDPRLSSFGS